MKKYNIILQFSLVLSLISLWLTNCKKTDYPSATTTEVNITGLLDAQPDSFSLFREILEVTGTASFLNAYGAYTAFIVTNQGVQRWMDSTGVSSIGSADVNHLKNLVRFHLLEDTITTGAFTDGKLKTATMYGQYLITGAGIVNGAASYTVNRQANIISSNRRMGNGIVHVIDRMLLPAARTLAQELESNADFSIFVQALKETGYYDTLNKVETDTSKLWKTVIAESNQALADSGYNSYADLKAKYSQTGNPSSPGDSLNMYIAYHIMRGLHYLGDIINFTTQLTLLPEEVISIDLQDQDIVLNESEFNGALERGVKLIRSESDNSATNGVWHSVNAHTMAKYRRPQALYWDVATFPEIMNQPAYFRRAWLGFNRAAESDKPVASIDWEYISASRTLNYEYGTSGSINTNSVFGDHVMLQFGNNRAKWWQFTTPAIIKGRYKVWICYVAQHSVGANVLINGIQMQRPINFNEFMPAGTPEELESIGWKSYITASDRWRHNSRLVGIVDIATTGNQQVRFEWNGSGGRECRIDMIHFIPVDDNQILPRFNRDGSMSFEP
ncbi:fasciclin domain-containing protein [Niabella yanshanensis]|uniref:Fasciclin domain-containing protein n=1 Tax=Niabella yanshanensis TaxID=577386 RepID=A0ABZ0W705_9BACT|nr:fasciclin domain-containing protein [Niabella yanshanensis]WQD37856.1 fasciclin domain-containing protein [Niabella yanshanensis]